MSLKWEYWIEARVPQPDGDVMIYRTTTFAEELLGPMRELAEREHPEAEMIITMRRTIPEKPIVERVYP